MQAELEQGLLKQIDAFRNKDIGGWKVGLTSGANRDGMGIGFRPFGHIERTQIFSSGVSLDTSKIQQIGVETELAFRFKDTVPGNATSTQLTSCIASVIPAFELNQRRLDSNATPAERLADNLSQWGIVCGSDVSDWTTIDLNKLSVSLFREDTLVAKVDSANHIDNHVDSLMALVENLNHFNLQIEAGHVVITGAFGRALIEESGRWIGDFGPEVGAVEVNWT